MNDKLKVELNNIVNSFISSNKLFPLDKKGYLQIALNDILYIHAYDITKKRYIKIYDFNTYTHIIQNNSVNF